VWFRVGDLRTTDNVLLARAVELGAPCLSVFVAAPELSATSVERDGLPRCGPARARFLIETLEDLRARLKAIGSHLIVATGSPSSVIGDLVAAAGAPPAAPSDTVVLLSDQPCAEEEAEAAAVAATVKDAGASVECHWQRTLFHPDDLPAECTTPSLPPAFTTWRQRLESSLTQPRDPLPAPTSVPPAWPGLELSALASLVPSAKAIGVDYLPSVRDLIGDAFESSRAAAVLRAAADAAARSAEEAEGMGCMADTPDGRFVGGETAALARVDNWVWEQHGLSTYFDTRNGMLGSAYSSKMAPWLAVGAISPRTLHANRLAYETAPEGGCGRSTKSTYWITFELLWRDWFSLQACKQGTKLFAPGGPRDGWCKRTWAGSTADFWDWAEGRTGWPLVDANMRELATTGFMSNRGRQNVASFLVHELGCDWRLGAAWFEATLLDYDCSQNWGNWAAIAGLFGGRLNRFNILKQSRDYDASGAYVKHWLPELRRVPTDKVHNPWSMSVAEQATASTRIGPDYPSPMRSKFVPTARRGGHAGGSRRDRRKGRDRSQRRKDRGASDRATHHGRKIVMSSATSAVEPRPRRHERLAYRKEARGVDVVVGGAGGRR